MPFDSKIVEVIRDGYGNLGVGVRSICEAIGIAPNNQIEKLKGNSRFNWYFSISVAADGKNRDTFCIPLNQLNGWLFGINPNKVPEHVRPALIAYQQECFQVLYKHFMPRGEMDLQPFMDRFDRLEKKIDHLAGAADAVFGDDKDEIQTLVQQVADAYEVAGRTVWGWVQTELDVNSYKKQNMRIKNFLKNKLGIGLKVVKP